MLLVEPATPYADEQRAWIEWARALPSTGRRPIAILLTHHHVDHVSGADVLSRELSLPLWAHADTAVILLRFEHQLVATIELSRCLPPSMQVPPTGEVARLMT